MVTGVPSLCARRVRSLPRNHLPPPPRTTRALSTTPPARKPPPEQPARAPGTPSTSQPSQTPRPTSTPNPTQAPGDDNPPRGALSRRLKQATEDALLSRSGRRAVEEAGFSEELRARLRASIPAADQRPGIPPSAGRGTRLHASSRPWTGAEEAGDAVLRMLDDAERKLPLDLRGPSSSSSAAVTAAAGTRGTGGARRIEGARARAASYKETGLSERERKEVRAELSERFGTGVRNMPALSLTGLASLANERIEDAIARGQFKDIPRGPGLKRDTTADNPFVDTTEYIMNNMLKKQNLVPPWIEKQQDIARAASALRTALRTSWARHVAGAIASRGGPRDEQLRVAEAYARAEGAARQPRRRADQGSVSAARTDDAVFKDAPPLLPARDAGSPESGACAGAGRPFRDPAWEERQAKFVALSVEELNAMTRSYNLMAPDLAKKAYFSADREMAGCFRDAAPLVAGVIRGRAGDKAEGPSLFGMGGAGGDGGVRERTGGQYGLKEMWRDIWGKGG